MSTIGELGIVVRVAGEDQAVASLRKLKDAEDQAALAAHKLAEASSKTGGRLRGLLRPTDAMKNRGRQLGQVFNELTEVTFGFTSALGRTNPQLMQLGINLAGAGNSAYMLGGAFGPLGVAVGAMIGMLPSLVAWLIDTGDELDNVADAAENATSWMKELDKAISKVRERQREESVRSAMALGVADPEVFLAQADIVSRQAGALFGSATKILEERAGVSRREAERLAREIERSGLTGGDAIMTLLAREGVSAGRAAGVAVEVGRILEQFRKVRAEADRLRAQAEEVAAMDAKIAAGQLELENEADRRTRRGSRRRAARGRRAARRADDGFSRLIGELAAGGPSLAELRAQAERELAAEEEEKIRRAKEAAAEKHQEKLTEIERKGILRRHELYQEKLEEMKRTNERYVEAAAAAGEALAQAFVSGESIPEAMAKVTADAIAKEARVQAAKEIAAAASAFATGNIAGGAAHTAAAAAWSAVPPVASALLGVGGGGGTVATPKAEQPVSGSSGERNREVVVNINAPVPEAMLGRDMDRARREARRRFGR